MLHWIRAPTATLTNHSPSPFPPKKGQLVLITIWVTDLYWNNNKSQHLKSRQLLCFTKENWKIIIKQNNRIPVLNQTMESKHTEGTQGRALEPEAGLETCTLVIDQEPPQLQEQTQAPQVLVWGLTLKSSSISGLGTILEGWGTLRRWRTHPGPAGWWNVVVIPRIPQHNAVLAGPGEAT